MSSKIKKVNGMIKEAFSSNRWNQMQRAIAKYQVKLWEN